MPRNSARTTVPMAPPQTGESLGCHLSTHGRSCSKLESELRPDIATPLRVELPLGRETVREHQRQADAIVPPPELEPRPGGRRDRPVGVAHALGEDAKDRHQVRTEPLARVAPV